MALEQEPGDRSLISRRAMEIVVALLLLTGSATVITDSVRLGFGWEGDGPAAGYFPFYIAVALAGASFVNLVGAVLARGGAGPTSFVSRVSMTRVLAVLVPTVLFVAAIHWTGIYVASAVFIVFFMTAIGREPVWRAVLVGLAVPIVIFLLFERWFLVPLPKGPLEAMLGY